MTAGSERADNTVLEAASVISKQLQKHNKSVLVMGSHTLKNIPFEHFSYATYVIGHGNCTGFDGTLIGNDRASTDPSDFIKMAEYLIAGVVLGCSELYLVGCDINNKTQSYSFATRLVECVLERNEKLVYCIPDHGKVFVDEEDVTCPNGWIFQHWGEQEEDDSPITKSDMNTAVRSWLGMKPFVSPSMGGRDPPPTGYMNSTAMASDYDYDQDISSDVKSSAID